MEKDTAIGGQRRGFPATRHSLIEAVGDTDTAVRRQAFGSLVQAYWKPVYKYVRIKWRESNEEAKDLTQGFFAAALEKNYFQGYDPERALFRTYLRTCVDRFVLHSRQAAARVKRGGGGEWSSLDFSGAERELDQVQNPDSLDLEDFFYREWARSLFGLALEDLKEHCVETGKELQYKIFERYDLEGSEGEARVTYSGLAEEFSLPETQVTNYLAFARRQFRRALLNRLREVTASDREFEAEAARLSQI